MLGDIKARVETFGVSRGTERKRDPVRWGILMLALLLLAGLVTTGWEAARLDAALDWSGVVAAKPASSASSPQPQAPALRPAGTDNVAFRWWLWIRIALLSFGLAATVVYYIRWEGRWADQHASSEFALQQFYIDVNRANWVVESCLEWRKETGSDVPDELLRSIGRGLFLTPDGPKELAIHPADELASALLGSASKLKLKAGESELEFDKPGKIPSKT